MKNNTKKTAMRKLVAAMAFSLMVSGASCAVYAAGGSGGAPGQQMEQGMQQPGGGPGFESQQPRGPGFEGQQTDGQRPGGQERPEERQASEKEQNTDEKQAPAENQRPEENAAPAASQEDQTQNDSAEEEAQQE